MRWKRNDLYTSEKQTKKGLQIHSDFPIQPPVIVSSPLRPWSWTTANSPPSLSLALSFSLTISVIHQTRLASGPQRALLFRGRQHVLSLSSHGRALDVCKLALTQMPSPGDGDWSAQPRCRWQKSLPPTVLEYLTSLSRSPRSRQATQ